MAVVQVGEGSDEQSESEAGHGSEGKGSATWRQAWTDHLQRFGAFGRMLLR